MLLNEYLFLFLNNCDQIRDTETKKYCKNLLEYTVIETSIYAKTKVFTYIESALDYVKNWSNHKHVVIIDIGNDLEVNGQFVQKLVENINDNDVLVGHILDKKDRYYELHNQCFYFNADVWRSIGCPDYGHSADKLTCKVPLRSEQNHHDDYTPFWIAPGKKVKTYKNVKQGYNFIKSFLDAGYTIKSFNQKVRNSKIYSYPYEKENKFNEIKDNNFRQKFYLFNTEKIKFDSLTQMPLNKMATVCAGLNHLKIIKHCGYDKKFELIFFDWDKTSINIMEKIYNSWNGIDYVKFVKNNTSCNIVADDFDFEKNFFKYFGGEKEFAKWFTEFKSNAKIEFIHLDLMKDNIYSLTEKFNGKGNELFWMSNIFHYKPSSILYDLKYRATRQDLIVNSLPLNTVCFADSCTLNQSKFFTKSSYKKQYPEALSFNEESLK